MMSTWQTQHLVERIGHRGKATGRPIRVFHKPTPLSPLNDGEPWATATVRERPNEPHVPRCKNLHRLCLGPLKAILPDLNELHHSGCSSAIDWLLRCWPWLVIQ